VKRPTLSLALAAVIVAVASTGIFAAENTKESLETVKANIEKKKAVLVDVREKSEWDKGHVQGAIFLPLSDLKNGVDKEKLAEKLPKDKILYTHCVVGKRSLSACEILEEQGYKVRSLKPGYKELLKAGFKKAED